MSSVEYYDFVLSRRKSPVDIQDSMARDGSWKPFQLMHAAFGLAGELLELEAAVEDENKVEELGDVLFFFAMFEECGWEFNEDAPHSDNRWYEDAADVIDLTKKYLIYENKNKLTELFAVLSRIKKSILMYAYYTHDLVEIELESLNIEKLKKRYPTGYSNAAAAARADKPAGE